MKCQLWNLKGFRCKSSCSTVTMNVWEHWSAEAAFLVDNEGSSEIIVSSWFLTSSRFLLLGLPFFVVPTTEPYFSNEDTMLVITERDGMCLLSYLVLKACWTNLGLPVLQYVLSKNTRVGVSYRIFKCWIFLEIFFYNNIILWILFKMICHMTRILPRFIIMFTF